jgi:chorismate dehydratase
MSRPAGCAEQLASGAVDVGLIPSIEYQRIPGLRIVPGIGVASSSEVRSVVLVRRPGAGQIRRVALDTSSRTSAALARILLTRRLGLEPEFLDHPPHLEVMLRSCDTALLIGDRALQVDSARYEILDLAQAWVEWQSRPFVFAFWACRPGMEDETSLCAMLEEARQWGWRHRDEIADVYAANLSLPREFLLDYLHSCIDYTFSVPHIDGLKRFYELAAEAGLTSGCRPLEFVSQTQEMRALVRG